MATIPVDTEIVDWKQDYPTTDTNSPSDADPIGVGLGDQVRNVKSVVRAESLNKQWERWLGQIGSFTFVNTTTFTMPDDWTDVAQVNRRVKATVTAGTIYGSITTSTFLSATTTVVVDWDSGVLDSGLSEIQFGSVTPDDTSIPFNQSSSGAAGVIQFSDGSGGFTGDAALSWVTATAKLLLAGFMDFTGIATGSAPAVSSAGSGRIYFDSTLSQFMVSLSGNPYVVLAAGNVTSLVRGSSTLVAGTATVTGLAQADTNYSITLGTNADEAVHWGTKTTGGFVITSSDLSSTSTVDWTVAR